MLIASSGTFEGILKMIKQFYYNDSVTLSLNDLKEYDVFLLKDNTVKKMTDVKVYKKKNRFRFEIKITKDI